MNTKTTKAIPCLDEFLRFLTTGQDPTGVIATDVHGEFNFPGTYFTLDNQLDFKHLRDRVSADDWTFDVERAEPTPTGFVVEGPHSQIGHSGERDVERTMTLVTVTEGRVTDVRHYCTGPI